MAEFTQYINKLQAKIVKYSQKPKRASGLLCVLFYGTSNIY